MKLLDFYTNTLSLRATDGDCMANRSPDIFFVINDTEQNGMEVLWDRSLNLDAALSWVEESFRDEPGFD